MSTFAYSLSLEKRFTDLRVDVGEFALQQTETRKKREREKEWKKTSIHTTNTDSPPDSIQQTFILFARFLLIPGLIFTVGVFYLLL